MKHVVEIFKDFSPKENTLEEIDLHIKSFVELNDVTAAIMAVRECVEEFVEFNYSIKCNKPEHFPINIKLELIESLFCLNGESLLPGNQISALVVASMLVNHSTQSERMLLWTLRVFVLQQSILSELSPLLRNKCLDLINLIMSSPKYPQFMEEDETSEMDFLLEIGYIYQEYYEHDKLNNIMTLLDQKKGISINTTGVPGRNTIHQTFDVSQLVVLITRSTEPQKSLIGENGDLVAETHKNIQLNDDLLYENMKPSVEVEKTPQLSATEIALVLFYARNEMSRRVKDVTQDLILSAYCQTLLCIQLGVFARISVLFIRSVVELSSPRKIYRGLMQLEELIKPCDIRHICHFFCTRPPSLYTIKCKLCRVYMSGGFYSSALELLETLEKWDGMIDCYGHLNKRGKAEELIRRRIAVKETPTLLCYLGSVTKEEEHYHRAWELSGHKSGASQRGLAFLHWHRNQIKEALPYFRRAVEINSLMYSVWFSYGCACMTQSLFKEGAKCFMSCVRIETESAKSWANLSICVMQYDTDKSRCIRMAQEAARLDYDNPKVWHNLLYITVDTTHIAVSIQAYKRLVDINQTFQDLEMLFSMASVVVDHNSLYLKELMNICRRHEETRVVAGKDGLLLYGTLTILQRKLLEKSPFMGDEYFLLLDYMSKCLTNQLHVKGWSVSETAVQSVENRASELLECCKYYSGKVDEYGGLRRLLHSTHSTIIRLRNMLNETDNVAGGTIDGLATAYIDFIGGLA